MDLGCGHWGSEVGARGHQGRGSKTGSRSLVLLERDVFANQFKGYSVTED